MPGSMVEGNSDQISRSSNSGYGPLFREYVSPERLALRERMTYAAWQYAEAEPMKSIPLQYAVDRIISYTGVTPGQARTALAEALQYDDDDPEHPPNVEMAATHGQDRHGYKECFTLHHKEWTELFELGCVIDWMVGAVRCEVAGHVSVGAFGLTVLVNEVDRLIGYVRWAAKQPRRSKKPKRNRGRPTGSVYDDLLPAMSGHFLSGDFKHLTDIANKAHRDAYGYDPTKSVRDTITGILRDWRKTEGKD